MDISVGREASFEVFKPKSKKVVEDPIFDSDPFPFEAFPKQDGAKVVSSESSPTKVTDFDEGFAGAQFITPDIKNSQNNSGDSFDPWIIGFDEEESKPKKSASLAFNNSDSEAPNKVLFPEDPEPKESVDRQDDELNRSSVDDVFSESLFTPELESSIKERYEDQKSDALRSRITPEDSIADEDQQSVKTRNTHWTISSGKDMKSVISDYISLPSFVAANEAGSPADSTGDKQDGANNDCEKDGISLACAQSRWKRLVAKLPQGEDVKSNILLVRQKIMECQEPTSVVVFDDNVVGPSGDAKDPSKKEDRVPDLNETISNESAFSYKSLQQFSKSVLSISQDMIDIASDASTPIRTQTRAKSSANPSDSIIPPLHSGDDASSSTLKLCIDLYEESAFRTLMSNLEGNTLVEEVHVFRSWEGKEERTRTNEDIGLLFKTIRSLSNLKMLNLANFLVEDIHFVSLTQWQNENLQTIRIHLCKGALSKRLLDVLATLPALKELTLEMNQSFPFHILLGSQTLESLTIVANGFDIDNLHAMEMVQELPKNDTLKKLIIEPALKLRTFKLLASALTKNVGVEFFQFSLLPGSEADTNRAMSELGRVLTANATLRIIRNMNFANIEVDDGTCDMVMKALSENYIIEDFLVFDEEPWFRDRKIRILKENKMEYDSVIPQVFRCGLQGGVGNGNNDGDASTVSAGGLASLSDNVKSQAQRVASGALDFVGQTVGLKK